MNLSIGLNIKRLRLEKGLTQEDVAAHLGVSFQAVSKWERCEGYPDIEMLPALSNYFGISVDSLLGVNDSEKKQDMMRLMHFGQIIIKRVFIRKM